MRMCRVTFMKLTERPPPYLFIFSLFLFATDHRDSVTMEMVMTPIFNSSLFIEEHCRREYQLNEE